MEKAIVGENMTLELSIGSVYSNFYYYYIRLNSINEIIGTCGIRLSNDKSIKYYGNIEYEIYPGYRGNNYALEATKLISKIALDQGITNLSITANPNNIASIKTIEKLGAKFVKAVKVPRNIKLYKNNKFLNVYEWKVGEKNDRYKIN